MCRQGVWCDITGVKDLLWTVTCGKVECQQLPPFWDGPSRSFGIIALQLSWPRTHWCRPVLSCVSTRYRVSSVWICFPGKRLGSILTVEQYSHQEEVLYVGEELFYYLFLENSCYTLAGNIYTFYFLDSRLLTSLQGRLSPPCVLATLKLDSLLLRSEWMSRLEAPGHLMQMILFFAIEGHR